MKRIVEKDDGSKYIIRDGGDGKFIVREMFTGDDGAKTVRKYVVDLGMSGKRLTNADGDDRFPVKDEFLVKAVRQKEPGSETEAKRDFVDLRFEKKIDDTKTIKSVFPEDDTKADRKVLIVKKGDVSTVKQENGTFKVTLVNDGETKMFDEITRIDDLTKTPGENVDVLIPAEPDLAV